MSTTAPLIGLLNKYGIDLPWMKKAKNFVWKEMDRLQEKHLFCHICTQRRLTFLEHTNDKEKAAQTLKDLSQWILTEGVLKTDSTEEGWGLYGKPHSLMYAPRPNHMLSPIFSTAQIEADVEGLIKAQKEDGRWDTWYGISDGMKLEWAGIQSLWSLRVLKAYGKIDNK